MKPGKQLIAEEREKVLSKISVDNDMLHHPFGQLASAAYFLSTGNATDYLWEISLPAGWSMGLWKKLYTKSYQERLVIAGQLYLAEADRCKAMAQKMAKQLDLIRTQEVEK